MQPNKGAKPMSNKKPHTSFNFGEFEVKSDKLMISDPCYTRGTWCQGIIENVIPGKWKTKAKIEPERTGRRVHEISALLIGEKKPTAWEKCKFEVGVDSGQAGIFDESIYPGGETGEYEEPGFYNDCCQVTAEAWCGVVPGGFVSRSGYGDGGYEAFISKNGDGKVVAVRVVFIE
jgi:hypothetical protein